MRTDHPTVRMRLLMLLPLAFAASTAPVAWANAGLTSAGVDPNTNAQQPAEPTLAQVAPIQPTPPGGSAAGATTPTASAAAAAPVVLPAGASGTQAGGGTTAAAAPARNPPRPVDPATLPVSVIRPLNQPEQQPATEPHSEAAPQPTAGPSRESQPTAAASAPPPPRGAAPRPALPPSTPARMSPARPHSDVAAAPKPDMPPPESATDNGSSSFIFYSGSGIAGAILLLTLAGFVRRRGEEPST